MNELIYFYGSSQSRLSQKGQVALPKRFRDLLKNNDLVILPGQGRCLYLYTHQQFSVIRDRVRETAIRDNDQEFFRSFMEQVHPLELDTQGRLVLSQDLRAQAAITENEVLFIGMDDRIEIWEPSSREKLRCGVDYAHKREQKSRDIFGI